MVAGIIVYCTTRPLTVNAATVDAEVPVGSRSLIIEPVEPSKTVTLFSKATNPSGTHLRTIVIECGAYDVLIAVQPLTLLEETIGICSPVAGAPGVAQIYGIFLPAGYVLKFLTLTPTVGTGLSIIHISYDD
jgi:hypothetical protein